MKHTKEFLDGLLAMGLLAMTAVVVAVLIVLASMVALVCILLWLNIGVPGLHSGYIMMIMLGELLGLFLLAGLGRALYLDLAELWRKRRPPATPEDPSPGGRL